jgi:hypothetical protein
METEAGGTTMAGNPAGPAGKGEGTNFTLKLAPAGKVTTPEATEKGWSLVTCPDCTAIPAKLPAGAVASKGLTAIHVEPESIVA